MRVQIYDWIFDDWPLLDGAIARDWTPIIYNGLPYVQFWVVMPEHAATVRCDPCSLDQDRTAYAAMVRTDLEQALRKAASERVVF